MLTLSEVVIITGLIIDSIGALGIVVPDLPDRYRNFARDYTPLMRKYVTEPERLDKFDDALESDDAYPIVKDVLENVWPAIRSHYEWQIRTNENYTSGWIGDYSSVNVLNTERGIVLQTPVRDRPFNMTRHGITNMAQKYVTEKFRVWGWILLSLGFVIQIMGILLS